MFFWPHETYTFIAFDSEGSSAQHPVSRALSLRKAATVPRTTLPMIGSPLVGPRSTCPAGFGVQVAFEGPRVVVGVEGDLDVQSAPTLRSVLHALVDGGHDLVVLDLASNTFMGAAGLGVIAATIARLVPTEGSLTLRSVPATTLRLLDITGLAANVAVEGANANADLRAGLAAAALAPARNRTLDTQLAIVVAIAAVTVSGADGVSVTLQRQGGLATVASSNDTVLRMDAHQYDTGEGPCLSAAGEGRAFHSGSLRDEDRWPAFVPLARGEGIASVLSTPLLVEGEPIGALNIYSNVEGSFGPYEHDLAAILAGQASRLLTHAVADLPADDVAGNIAAALRSRLVLAQAQGVLMARHHVTAEEATDTFHRGARAAAVSVLDYAGDVVASTRAGSGRVVPPARYVGHVDPDVELGPIDRLVGG